MANLKLIKDLAEIKGFTIEALAEKVGVSTQAIHLMGRTGKTKLETLEKLAEVLEVPTYVFFDEKFDTQMFRDYVVMGHHNPTSFFGPVYNDGSGVTAKEELEEVKAMEKDTAKESKELVAAKDETIAILQKQVEELREDKASLRAEIQALKSEISALREHKK